MDFLNDDDDEIQENILEEKEQIHANLEIKLVSSQLPALGSMAPIYMKGEIKSLFNPIP